MRCSMVHSVMQDMNPEDEDAEKPLVPCPPDHLRAMNSGSSSSSRCAECAVWCGVWSVVDWLAVQNKQLAFEPGMAVDEL